MGDLREQIIARLAGDGVHRLLTALGHQPVQAGREWKILCPFHDDSKPSLTVNAQKGKNGAGIFKCFACEWGGDAFSFVQDSQRLEGFRDALNLMARILGIEARGEVRRGGGPVELRESKAPEIKALTPGEIADDLAVYRERSLDPAAWCAKLGLTARGLELCGGLISTYLPPRRAAGQGMPVMVVPQRRPDAGLCSLRIASFEPRRKWSHDRKALVDGEEVQTHHTEGGLMAPLWQFETPPNEFQVSIVVEGESDMLAGVDMMLPYAQGPVGGEEDEGGSGFEEWPARWWGLPGVNACHDMLVPELLGSQVIFLFDPDQGGRRAAFDRRSRVKNKSTGEMVVNLDGDVIPGAIRKARARGMYAVACFPPSVAGSDKADVRRLRQAGWDWAMLWEHIVANPRGLVA